MATPHDIERRTPQPPEPGAGPATPRSHLADAGGLEALTMRKLGGGTRRRGDGAVPPLRQQGRPRRRDGRPRLRRDRAARGRCRLEDRHAAAGDLGPRRAAAPPLGDRPDGVADQPRSREPAPPRRGDRQSSGRRLRHRHGRPRLLAPGQLHLRLRADEDEPPVRDVGRDRRGGGDACSSRSRSTSTRT